MVAKRNQIIISVIIIAILTALAVFWWRQNRQSLTVPVPLETSESELKALQQQLNQLLELRQQLEEK